MYDICIIGGGAAGMYTAIELTNKNKNLNIIVLEKNDKVGLKIKKTGNGKCNISNNRCANFGKTVKFFKNIGVEIKTNENGWAYPVSESADDVVYAMENAIKRNNINIIVNYNVLDVKPIKGDYFEIIGECKKEKKALKIFSKKVVFAMGGKAAPQFGTVGEGYILAKKLGHKVTKLAPCLVPLECFNEVMGTNKGVRSKGKVSLYCHNRLIDMQEGEIQFTKDGLSGICIFNLSKYVLLDADTRFEDYIIELDLLSRYKEIEIFYILSDRRKIKEYPTKDLLNGIVRRELAEKILKQYEKQTEFARNIDDETLKEIIKSFKKIKYIVTGAKGWKEAQCTTGGIAFDMIDEITLESKVQKGIYFTGEMLEYSGQCGGYNLENAWESARKVSEGICTGLTK